jgi:hypothetical protein
MAAQGPVGVTIWKTIFACVYIGKIFSRIIKPESIPRFAKFIFLESWILRVVCWHIRGNHSCIHVSKMIENLPPEPEMFQICTAVF